MAKKTTREQLEKVVSNIDESKETMIVIHFDMETKYLGMFTAGGNAELCATVSSALMENPMENQLAEALLKGFAIANYVQKGKLVKTINSMRKHLEENEMKDHSVIVHRGNGSEDEKGAESLMNQMIAELNKGVEVEDVVDKYIKCETPELRQKTIDGINKIRNRFTIGSNHK